MATIRIEFTTQGADVALKEQRALNTAFRAGKKRADELTASLTKLSAVDAGNFGQKIKTSIDGVAVSSKNLSNELKKTAAATQQFDKAAGKSTSDVAASVAKLRSASGSVGQSTRQVAQGAGAAVTELQRLKVASDSTAQGSTRLAKALNTNFKGAQEFSKSIGLTTDTTAKAVARIRELDQSGANAGAKFNVLNKELGISRTQFLAIDRAAGVTTRGLSTIGTAAAAAAAGIGALFVAGGRSFIAFDSAIRQSGAIAGASTEEIGVLRNEVTRLGIETSKAPAEIAQTSVALSRAGFAAGETAQALRGVVAASEATGESLQVTGDIISKTLRTFQLSADESERVGNILVATANNTNTTVSSIGESLTFVGSVASAANQPLEDIAIAIGLLGDAGIQGGVAGTNLAAALERLKAASAGANSEYSNLVRGNQRAIEAFNLIGASVRNADGSMKSIVEILPALRAGLQGLGQEDQDLVFKALFGVQGGNAIQTLLLATEERVDSVTDSIQNSGDAADEAATKLKQGLGGALNLLSGSVGSALVESFTPFAPIVEVIVRAATLLLNTFLALPAPIKTLLALSAGFAGVLAAATAALVAYNVAGGATIRTETLKAQAFLKKTIALKIQTAQTTAAAIAEATLAGGFKAGAVAAGVNTTALSANAAAAAKLAIGLAGFFVLLKGIESAFKQLAIKRGTTEELKALTATIEAFIEPAEDAEDQARSLQTALDNIGQSEGGFDSITAGVLELANSFGFGADSVDTFGNSFGPATLAQRENQQQQLLIADAIGQLGDAAQKTSDDLLKYSVVAGEGEDALALGTVRAQEFTEAISANTQALSSEIQFLESLKTGVEEIDAQLDAEIATRQKLIDITRKRANELLGETAAVDQALAAAEALDGFLQRVSVTEAATQQLITVSALRAEAQALADVASGAISEAEGNANIAEARQRALEQSIDRQQRALDELNQRRANTNEEDEAGAKALNDAILEAEEGLLASKIQLFGIEATERKKALDGAVADNQAALTAIELSTAQATAALLEGGGTAQQVADLEAKAIEQRLEQNRKLLEQLQQQPESPEVADQILATEKAIADDRIKIAQDTVKNLEATEKQRIEDLKDAIAEAERVVETENTARERSLLELERSLIAAGETETAIAERVAAEKLQADQDSINARIALERKRIATFGEGSDEAKDAILEIAGLENELLQTQIDGERRIRDLAQSRLDEQIKLEERRQQIIIDTLQFQDDSLRRQGEFLQQQAQLSQAAAGLQDTVLTGQIAKQKTALDLLRQQQQIEEERANITADPDADPLEQAEKLRKLDEQRLAVRRQLNALGIRQGASERAIEAEILALQKKRFGEEFANLRQKQEAEALSLEIQIEQNRLANERAIIEAQIAQARIQAELVLARQQGNTGLVSALSQSLGLQDQLLGKLQEQQALEEQSTQNIRDTLALQQGRETVGFLNNFANEARDLAGEITSPALAQQAEQFARGVQTIADGAATAAGEAAKQAAGDAAVQIDRSADVLAASGVTAGRAIVDAARTAGEILSRINLGGGGAVPAFRSGGVAPGGLVQVHRDEFMVPPRGTQIVSQKDSRDLIRESLAPVNAVATQGNDQRLLRAVTKLERAIRAMPTPQLNQQNYFPVDDQNWRSQSNRNALDMWAVLRGI